VGLGRAAAGRRRQPLDINEDAAQGAQHVKLTAVFGVARRAAGLPSAGRWPKSTGTPKSADPASPACAGVAPRWSSLVPVTHSPPPLSAGGSEGCRNRSSRARGAGVTPTHSLSPRTLSRATGVQGTPTPILGPVWPMAHSPEKKNRQHAESAAAPRSSYVPDTTPRVCPCTLMQVSLRSAGAEALAKTPLHKA